MYLLVQFASCAFNSIEECQEEFLESGSCAVENNNANERSHDTTTDENNLVQIVSCKSPSKVRAFFDYEKHKNDERETEEKNKYCK